MRMAEAGYFGDDSMLRRVHRETVVALSGPRALLMQAAHPLAFAGLLAHTGALDEPYERLSRTARVMNAIAWGTREDADRATRRVRAMHRRVRGVLDEPAGRFPAGTPYAADDPALLLWVLGSLADSALVVYQKYVGRLSPAEREAFWQDYKVIGRLFGLRDADMPRSLDDFDEYMRTMVEGDELHVSARARELAVELLLRRPVPLPFRPVRELVNQITVGLLPGEIRRRYGLWWDPARSVALHAGAEYVRRVVVPLLPAQLRFAPKARAA